MDVIEKVMETLDKLEVAIKASHKRLLRTSILICYDSRRALGKAGVKIAMIDFAHVSELKNGEVDQKLLIGICELRRLLKELTAMVKGRVRPGRNQSLSPDLCAIDDIGELQLE